jgi:protocatechuate 3,4-dioxygenase, beta subunit
MQEQNKLTRRRMLSMSLALGGYVLSSPLEHLLAQQRLRRTPDQILGPFYPMMKPLDRDADLTIINGRKERAKGQVIHLMGHVLNIQGNPVEGARVEIWQANAEGRYTHPDDSNPAPLDPNFHGYGVQVTDKNGGYRFKTIRPGAYPTAVEGWTRPPHIHFDVTGRTNQFVTQMYFAGESLNDKDRLLQSAANKEMLVASLMQPTKDFEPDSLVVNWDIVLLSG